MLVEPAQNPYDLRFVLFGTRVRVHPFFWLFSAILGWPFLDEGFGYLLLWVGCCFVSILLHEFGHVWAGQAFGNRGSIVWTEHRALASALLALDDEAFAAELARRFGDFLGRLRIEGPRWSYPLALLHAARYVDERLALTGDAAHAIHPIAGQR